MASKPEPADPRLARLAEARIAIEAVDPEIDAGRFPAKAIVGEPLTVEADIFGDGHTPLQAVLMTRPRGERRWSETPMRLIVNDRWRATASFPENRAYEYTVAAWQDRFQGWREEVVKKHGAGQPIALDLREGEELLLRTAAESRSRSNESRAALRQVAKELKAAKSEGDRFALLMSDHALVLMSRCGLRHHFSRYAAVLPLTVDRERAAFSAWYELMPRSQSGDPGRHGTFDDVVARLPYIRDLGFDVLYLTPIHPIGRSNRKGRNNSLKAEPTDPGSPYAIGAKEGGHDALHPELGDFDSFARLVDAAREHGLEVALDFAIQCAPDHPWVKQHPEWFDWRPDGTIKFAENPPKKYEDIVNLHFYREALPGIWHALRDIVLFWVGRGVRIFRVDNPHTKPLPFWEWLIAEVNAKHPDVIFLSEAFTRPKMMKRLGKVGFQQSYSYFTWRDTKAELTEYMTELTTQECRHTMRPNFFVNTPDINPRSLQGSGRPGFRIRAFLAATLAGNWGMYNGFELCEAEAIPGKEEYLNSEKYEIRAWDWDRPGNIKSDIRFLNEIRNGNAALRGFTNLTFYNAWNDRILYYGKRTADLSSFLLFAVTLDPREPQGAHFEVPLWELGLPDHATVEAEDLVTGQPFAWQGKVQHMWVDPHDRPYMVWRLLAPQVQR